MSSSAEGDLDGAACRKCGARPARSNWLFFLGATILSLGLLPVSPGPFCDDCGDGKDLLGVLMLVAILAVVFVLAVIWLG